MAKQEIHEDDLQKLIEIAHQLSQEKKNNYQFEDVKQIANEMGIGEDKINQAYQILQKEKEQKAKEAKAQQARLYSYGIWIGTFMLIAGLVYYCNLPNPPFAGTVKLTMASEIKDFQAVDELTNISLFHYDKIYVHTKFLGLKNNAKAKWKFVKPDGEVYDEVRLDLTDVSESYNAYASTLLKFNTPTGKWKVQMFVDEKLFAEKSFEVDYGECTLRLTAKLDTSRNDNLPADVRNVFSKQKDKYVYTYLDWEYLKHNGKINYKWYLPDGTLADETDFLTKSSGGGYWAYAALNLQKAGIGIHKVVIFFEKAKVFEKNFTVTE
jgi:hypothetical protein